MPQCIDEFAMFQRPGNFGDFPVMMTPEGNLWHLQLILLKRHGLPIDHLWMNIAN